MHHGSSAASEHQGPAAGHDGTGCEEAGCVDSGAGEPLLRAALTTRTAGLRGNPDRQGHP